MSRRATAAALLFITVVSLQLMCTRVCLYVRMKIEQQIDGDRQKNRSK